MGYAESDSNYISDCPYHVTKRSQNVTGNMTGKVFNDRYEIIDRVGIGGMAEVYRARDKVLDRIVAVKVMLPQYAADETFTKRFRQEAASAAAMQSPYIVSIYDWGQDGNTYYIVMEYVRGSDLKTGIVERGAINQRKVAEIGSQVAAALSVAHSHDIIHRDIKPQNIMIQPDGNAKVMDFGIARAKGASLTQTSSVLGTAHYISPEQAQGKDLTPASDIYSLGVVMYEAVTGRLPFDGPDAVSVALKQVSEIPSPPHTIKPDIDPSLEAIIMMAMAKDPKARFSSAAEMRKALNEFLMGRPVSAISSFAAAETGYIGNVPPAINTTPGTQVMTPLTNTVQPVTTNKTRQYAPEPEPKSGKGKTIGIIVAIVAVIAIIAGIAFFMLGNTGETVPDVIGKTEAEARTAITDAGFKVGTITYSYSETVETGKVISQTPDRGLKSTTGTAINLVVSQGAESITVPNLSNMTAEEAQAALKKVGLNAVAGTAAYSSTVEKGKVVSQSPASGQSVAKGSTVEYVLSLGVEQKTVPNVVNYTEADATATLKDAGFAVKIERGYSSEVDEGYVYKQSPSSGKAEADSEVTIYVSRGAEQATVPYVCDLTVSRARAALENAGFNVVVMGDTSESATVVSQSPDAYQSAATGSTVYITGSSKLN